MIINQGEIFGFLGPNGAGKTTTIKMIVGITDMDKGDIVINGIDIKKDPIGAKSILSYVPDNPDIYENMTGIQYLNFLADIFEVSTNIRQERIEKYSQIFEIKDSLSDLISGYSHGMKQKIVLIGALIIVGFTFYWIGMMFILPAFRRGELSIDGIGKLSIFFLTLYLIIGAIFFKINIESTNEKLRKLDI